MTDSITSTPTVIVQELAILEEVYLEYLNKPGRGKDYLCCLCHFSQSNLDLMLTYVRRHLKITIGCPVCGCGYQNAVSLQKHSGDAHNIQIIAPTPMLQGPADPEEEV